MSLDGVVIICNICNKTFNKKYNLERHIPCKQI